MFVLLEGTASVIWKESEFTVEQQALAVLSGPCLQACQGKVMATLSDLPFLVTPDNV